MSIDVNGYDNSPEWGTCKAEDCKEDAFPIWLAGDYPDDPDLLLCPKHIGARILRAETAQKAWTEIGARGQGVADAARALRQAIADLNGISAAEQALWAALHTYDAAVKAREM